MLLMSTRDNKAACKSHSVHILYSNTNICRLNKALYRGNGPWSFGSPVKQLPKESKLAFLIVVGKLRSWETFYSRRINSDCGSKDDYGISHNERKIQTRHYLLGDLIKIKKKPIRMHITDDLIFIIFFICNIYVAFITWSFHFLIGPSALARIR